MPGDVTRWTDSAARRVAEAVRTTEAAPWVKGGQTINRGRNGSVTPVHTRLGRIDSESSGGQYSVTFMRAASASSLEAVPSIDAVTAYEVNGTEALIADGTVVVVLIGVLDQDGGIVWLFKVDSITPKRSIEFDTDDEEDGQLQLVGDEESPGVDKVYGTDGSGVRGWKADPTGTVYTADETWITVGSDNVITHIGPSTDATITGYVAASVPADLSGGASLADVINKVNELFGVMQALNVDRRGHTNAIGGIPPNGLDPDDGLVSANLVMWLDADQLTSLADDDPLTTWTDESGNGNSPAGSGSTRPLYKTSIINGLPAIYYDGTDDYLFKSTNVLPYGSDWTLFIVCKDIGQHAPISSNDGTSDSSSSDTSWRLDSKFGNYRSTVGYLGAQTIGSDNSGWHIFVLDNTASTTVRSWMDGTAGTDLSLGAWQTNDVMLGRYHTGAAFEYHEGYIAEVIAYNAKLSDTLRVAVQNYLSTKYGIAVS